MLKRFLLILPGFCFLCPLAHAAYMAPADPPAVVNDINAPGNNPYGGDFEKILKVQEDFLRKIKIKHENKEQKQHIKITEKVYQKAVSLYNKRRSTQARDTFVRVEDSMADYKSTLSFLKTIDNKNIEKLKISMYNLRDMQQTPLVVNLAQQASAAYRQVESLGYDKNIAAATDKLNKVKKVLERIKCKKVQATQRIAQQERLDQMTHEADEFDHQIARLIGAKDYEDAKKEYDAFHQAMTDQLRGLKQDIIRSSEGQGETVYDKFKEQGYRASEQATFREGIDLYRKKQYLEAKGIFDELASQGDQRAMAYSRKIDRLMQ